VCHKEIQCNVNWYIPYYGSHNDNVQDNIRKAIMKESLLKAEEEDQERGYVLKKLMSKRSVF